MGCGSVGLGMSWFLGDSVGEVRIGMALGRVWSGTLSQGVDIKLGVAMVG